MSKPTISSYFKTTNKDSSGRDIYDQGRQDMLGQVEKIHFVNDPTNRSKKFVEYDVSVRDARGGQSVYKNCRAMGGGSSSDFDETILEANSYAFSGKLDPSNRFGNKNGALVVVSFLNASIDKPYISNLLDNPRADGAKRSDGIRKLGSFRGIEYEINKDGELRITQNSAPNPDGSPSNSAIAGTEFKVDKNGDISFSSNAGQEFNIKRSDATITLTDGTNTITIDQNANTMTLDTGGSTVLIDGASGDITATGSNKITLAGAFVDLGASVTDFVAKFTDLQTAFNLHTHAIPGNVGPPSTTPPTGPLMDIVKSETVKVQD